jgi:TPR repeat protein
MKKLLLILFLLTSQSNISNAQLLSDITDVCGENITVNEGNSFFIISELCKVANVKNNFLLIPCKNITYCNAFQKNYKKYIFYNPEFIKQLKNFNFGLGLTVDSINTKFNEWEAVASFAHEISHHLCGHLPVGNCKLTKQEMELQADEYAGYLLYKLNASLSQSQKLFNSKDFPINQTVDYPARLDRLTAVKKGYENAQRQLVINVENSTISYRKLGNLSQEENNKLAREHYKKALELFNEKKYNDCISLLNKSADLNFSDAFNMLGCIYKSNNFGVSKDLGKTIYWWTKSAEQNNAVGQSNFGWAYLNSVGVQKDPYKAVFWLQKAANQGHAYAQMLLGNCHLQEIGGLKNDYFGFSLITKAAIQGDNYAQYLLGTQLLYGSIHIQKNAKEGYTLVKNSADLGIPEAEYNVGFCLYRGDIYPSKDLVSAIYWLKKAEQHGILQAQLTLGYVYIETLKNSVLDGEIDDFDLNFIEGKKYIDKSLNRGELEANSCMGDLYLVKYSFNKLLRNKAKSYLDEAEKWYQIAADKGLASGFEGLGDVYMQKEKFRKAMEYYNNPLLLNSESVKEKMEIYRQAGIIK